MNVFGGIEAGGTKFNCMIGSSPQNIIAEGRFPTTQPGETLDKVVSFFKQNLAGTQFSLVSIGVACFGPVDLDPASPQFGFITSTPKPGWADCEIGGYIQRALGVPIAFETDVNGAAIGEMTWGAAQGLSEFVYFTIGTGIGGGAIVAGKPLHGLVHPEMGHIRIPHDWSEDPFEGVCPYHGDCFEGLASGAALNQRWGQPAETFPEEHPAWALEAKYIALAVQNTICTLSPQRILLGGGVMAQRHLFSMIRVLTRDYLNGYVQSPSIQMDLDAYIVPPGLGSRAGVLGALAMAMALAG